MGRNSPYFQFSIFSTKLQNSIKIFINPLEFSIVFFLSSPGIPSKFLSLNGIFKIKTPRNSVVLNRFTDIFWKNQGGTDFFWESSITATSDLFILQCHENQTDCVRPVFKIKIDFQFTEVVSVLFYNTKPIRPGTLSIKLQKNTILKNSVKSSNSRTGKFLF